MDLLQQGKQLAQNGNYEEALDSFVLALENDKENPDIHYYIGACYSAKEEFRFAKYHYEIALRLQPDHPKAKMMIEGLADYTSEKPPERKQVRGATARTRKKQAAEAQEESTGMSQADETPMSNAGGAEVYSEPRIKLTDDKWEQAFPEEELIGKSKSSSLGSLFMWLIILAILAGAGYFVWQNYL